MELHTTAAWCSYTISGYLTINCNIHVANLKEAFDKLCETQNEMDYYEKMQSFIYYFRLGIQLNITWIGEKNSFSLDLDV